MVYLFFLGRVLFGGYFIKAGLNHFRNLTMMTGYAQSKGVPMARESVVVTGLMLVLGGIGILCGIYVSLSVLLLVIFLLGTLVKMHNYWTVSDQMARMSENVNFYKNVALIGALLMLLAIPLPWAMSLVM